MTKFAIEKYVSEHHARELECVSLKTFSQRATPENALTHVRFAFQALRQVLASGRSVLLCARNEAHLLIYAEDRASSNTSRLPLAREETWSKRMSWMPCAGSNLHQRIGARNLPRAFRVYVTRYTKSNLFFLSRYHSAFEQNGETDLLKLARIYFRKKLLFFEFLFK